jgi:hypothetical protein
MRKEQYKKANSSVNERQIVRFGAETERIGELQGDANTSSKTWPTKTEVICSGNAIEARYRSWPFIFGSSTRGHEVACSLSGYIILRQPNETVLPIQRGCRSGNETISRTKNLVKNCSQP